MKPLIIIGIIVIAVILIAIFCYYQNNSIVISKHLQKTSKLSKNEKIRIVHISDLHNKCFGANQKHIISKIESQKPNVIVITGDLIDRRRYNLDIAMEFINEAIKIAPIYYVPGNHEAKFDIYKEVKPALQKAGVNVLDNNTVTLENHQNIAITGFNDKWFSETTIAEGFDEKQMIAYSSSLDSSKFNLLLCHRPELFETYVSCDFDAVMSGHAHGGQIRIPFTHQGILSPDQHIFPDLTEGSHRKNNTTLYVSRGLGNSSFPLRVFNLPEIIVLDIASDN